MSKSTIQTFLLASVSTAPIFLLWGCRGGGENESCDSDADCGGWFKCDGSGACNPKTCTNNGECPGDDAMCHSSGFCAQECTDDSDCQGNGIFRCLKEGMASSGVCTAGCVVDEDCSYDSRSLFSCDSTIGMCKPGNYHGACKIDLKCESCDASNESKCLYCSVQNHEPDMYGVCQPVCKTSASAATYATDL